MNHSFPAISEPLAAALAAFQANADQAANLTPQRDAVRAELQTLEATGENTESTVTAIAAKRISLDLFERDLNQLAAERPALHQALATAFNEFRRTSEAACEEFRDAVNELANTAARKAWEPYEANIESARRFRFEHADNNYSSSDLTILLKHAPRLLKAWGEFTKGRPCVD